MISRRRFVRVVPALGAFTMAAQTSEAQAPDVAAWPPVPPAEGAPRDVFIVDSAQNALGQNTLGLTRTGSTRLVLTHLGKLHFHPAGAPAVRIRFERIDGKSILTVLDPDVVVIARRT